MSGSNCLTFFHDISAALYWALITHNINVSFGLGEVGKSLSVVSGTL